MEKLKYCINKTCPHCQQRKTYPAFCTYCNWCGASLNSVPTPTLKDDVKSQKARGLLVLCHYSNELYPLSVSMPLAVVRTAEELEKWWKARFQEGHEFDPEKELPAPFMFARPCPKTPRHGFVDSRIVKTFTEAKGVLEETLEADPDGELMLVSPIDASRNAVATGGLLTIGNGNDGATAGKGVVNFPLPPKLSVSTDLLSLAGITDAPYFEAVQTKDNAWILTQLRNGPALTSGASDFVPSKIIVQKVITPNGMDLLEWEKLILSQKDVPGVVVNNPTGSLVDHYSVHARCSGIPVITTRIVQEGETLEAIEGNKLDPQSVLEGLVVADHIPLPFPKGNDGFYSKILPTGESIKHWCDLSIACFHGGNNAGGDQSWWLGLGAGLLIRFGSLACRGEARHINQQNKLSRNHVYSTHADHSIARQRAALPRLVHTLRYGDFGGSSVGGLKWAQCGKAIGDMLDAVGELARKKDQDSLNALIKTYNIALNQAHNNGWWLNKFTSHEAFTYLQVGDLTAVLPLVTEITLAAKIKEGVQLGKISVWAKWKPLSYRVPSVANATLEATPGMPGVQFRVNDRFLKARRKPVTIPSHELLPKLLSRLGGKVILVSGPEGIRLLLKGEEEEVLWQEEPLTPQEVKPTIQQ